MLKTLQDWLEPPAVETIDSMIIRETLSGLSSGQIRRKYGMSRSTVNHRLARLRKRGKLPPGVNGRPPAVLVSEEELITAWFSPNSADKIADELNWNPTTLRRRWKALQEAGKIPTELRKEPEQSSHDRIAAEEHEVKSDREYKKTLKNTKLASERLLALLQLHHGEPRYDIPEGLRNDRRRAC